MNSPAISSIVHPSRRGISGVVGALLWILATLVCLPAIGADGPGLSEKAKDAAEKTTAAVEEAGRSVAAEAEALWQRLDAAGLKHRTSDEIIAWAIMGVLVGAVAGMMTSLKPTGLGQLGRLLLGLTGAFLGGILVRITHMDFGWGLVLIRYEELLVSFLGAILLVVVARLVRARVRKRGSAK